MNSKLINIWFNNLSLGSRDGHYIAGEGLEHALVQVYDENKQIKASFAYAELPKQICNLVDLQDYRVLVTI